MKELIEHLERYAQGMRDAAKRADQDAVYADFATQDRDRAKSFRRDAAKYQRWADQVRKVDVFAAAMESSKSIFIDYAGHTGRIYVNGAYSKGIDYQAYDHARPENELMPRMDAKQNEVERLEEMAQMIRDLEKL